VPVSASIGTGALYFFALRPPPPAYPITITTRGGGSVQVNPAQESYPAGTAVTVSAQPEPGWSILQWIGDLSGGTASTNITISRPTFAEAVFGTSLQTTVIGNGSVQFEPPGATYPYGAQLRLYALPDLGHYFHFWGHSFSGTHSPLVVTLTNAGLNIGAVFSPLSSGTHALTVAATGFGQALVTPPGHVFHDGSIVTITAMPNAGQSFKGWSGDAAGNANPLQITLNQSRTIVASFTSNPIFTASDNFTGMNPQGFRFSVIGRQSDAYSIVASTNLLDWIWLASITNNFGHVQFTDTNAQHLPERFYRLELAPNTEHR
jgi:hypothetical protein